MSIKPTTVNIEEFYKGKDLHESTWEFGNYTLTSNVIVSPDGTESLPKWSVSSSNRDLPSIDNNASYASGETVFGVNWSAMGTKSAATARLYAIDLLQAAEAAEYFNGIVAQ